MTIQAGHSKIDITIAGVDNIRRFWIQPNVSPTDYAAGASVSITVKSVAGAGSTVAAPDTLKLKIADSQHTQLIKEFTFTAGHPAAGGADTSQTFTFWFTTDGNSGSAARAGTIEMVLEAINTTGMAAENYNIQSDGSNSAGTAAAVPPTGATLDLIRGYLRGSTTGTISTSNVSAGGAEPNPFAYPDSVFHRAVLAAPLYESKTLTHTLTGRTAGPVNATSGAAATTTFDATFAAEIDERWPAAVTAGSASASIGNGSLTNANFATGGGDTGAAYAPITWTNDSFNADPRLTASHLFQVDDDVFGTPPTSKNVAAKEMLTSQTGFMSTRIVNARGEGQNGITLTQLMDPVLPGSDVGPTSGVTATQGGEAGWSPFLTWGSSKPGGTWNKTSDVTAPAAIDNNAHLVGGTDAYTMLAVNPNFRVIVNGGVATGGQTGDHWHPGETMQVAATLVNMGIMDLLTPLGTAGKEPKCVIARFRDNGEVETLRADTYSPAHVVSAATWVTLPDDSDPLTVGNLITLTRADAVLGASADKRVWLVQIHSSITATFDTHDLVVIARFYDSSGTPYANSFVMDVLSSAANAHHADKFDPIGLFK